jgi:hypothetical protein
MKFVRILIILSILGIGFFLRIWHINESAANIGFDEAALGYNAYSLMLTGKDEHAFKYPISLKSFGDYKPAMYTYLTIPFIKVFGLSNLSLRMVSAIAGLVLAYFVYLILGLYVKEEKYRIAGLVLAVMQPWSLHFSRVALETNLSAAFFTMGIYFYLRNRNKFNIGVYIGYILCFIASIYSYHGARVAVPLFLVLMQADPIKWMLKDKKIRFDWKEILSIVVIVLFYMPIFLNASAMSVLTRFNQENFFRIYTPYAPKELLKFPLIKFYYLIGMLTGRLWSYFSPINWGGRIYIWIRQSVMHIPEFGMVGWIESIMFIVGVVLIIKNIIKDKYRVLVYWLVAGLAPAAATWNWFHPLRCLNALGSVEIICFLGMIYVYKKLGLFLKIVFLSLVLVQFVFIVNNEIGFSYYETHGNFQPGGFMEGEEIIKKFYDKYDQIIVDSPQAQSYIFILYYFKIDPILVQKESYGRKPNERRSWNVDFGKFKFRTINWNEDKKLKKTILWMFPNVDVKSIDELPNAKYYYTKHPINLWDSSIIVTLD